MGTNVSTDGRNYISQYAKAWTLQPADPVYLLDKNIPGVAAHANKSATLSNAAGTVFDHGTLVAHRYSAMGDGKHAPVVSPKGGLITSIKDGVNIFLNFQKTVFIESANVVMHAVQTGTAAIWNLLPPEIKTAANNAEKIVGGLQAKDFAKAAQDEVQALMDYLSSPEGIKDMAVTLAMVGAQAIPVVGQVVGAIGAAQRVKNVAETLGGAKEQLTAMAERWSQPMTPAQIEAERGKLATLITNVGVSALLSALGKIMGKLSKKSTGTENKSTPVNSGTSSGPSANTGCACAIGKPVIIATGEKLLDQLDFSLPGPIPLSWRRRYRSGDARRDGWFGQGWSHPLATELWLQADGLKLFDAQGRSVPLPHVDVGQRHFEAYEQFTLAHPTEDHWLLEYTSGLTQHYHRRAQDEWRLPLQALSDRNGNRVVLEFDAADFGPDFNPFATPPRPKLLIDSAHRVLQLDWSESQQLRSVGLQWRNERDEAERVALATYDYSASEAVGHSQTANAKQFPDLVVHTNGNGQSRHFEWESHLLVGYTLATGHRHSNRYDSAQPTGRVVESLALDDGTGLQFDYAGRVTLVQDMLGRVTAYAHDARQDIVAVRDAAGQVTHTPFDANGHPKGSTDALGRNTSTVFDARGNLTKLIDASGAVTQIEYNTLDLPIKLTDAMGGIWLREYDLRGNLLASTDPLGQTTRYEVDAHGQVVAILDAAGRRKLLQWDEAGDLIAYTDCTGNTTRFAYDALGRLHTSTDALGHTTRYRFDVQGRLTAQQQPDGAIQHYMWDGEGNLAATTDAVGHTTRWRYNGAGDVLERTDALGQSITYHHDEAGRLVSLINEAGAATRFVYDVLDRLTDEIGFDGRHQRYVYNAAGELTHLIERGGCTFGPGKVTHFERDALGRLVSKRHDDITLTSTEIGSRESATTDEGREDPANCNATYAYDALGRLTQAASALSTVEFAYDPVGQLTREAQHLRLPASLNSSGQAPLSRTYSFTHQYDPLGNRTATRLPSGQTLNHLFYGPGHLHQINLDGQVISDIERDAIHREVSRTQGQLRSEFAYDPAGRLVAQRVTRGAANEPALQHSPSEASALTGLIERRYAYDAAGQLRQWLDRDRGLTQYGYDAIGRIVQSQIGLRSPGVAFGPSANKSFSGGLRPARAIPVTTELFHWDATSNPVAGASQDQRASAVPGNRLTVWQDERYRYDEHGNLIERIQGKRGSAAQTLTRLHWDAAHQLVRAEVTRGADANTATTQSFEYAYDALGRRVAKLDAFGCTHFAWDGDRMAIEQRGGNSTITLYEPNSFVPIAQMHNGVLHHLHTDHLGTPLEASNDAGEVTWRITYRAWGAVLTEEITAEKLVGMAASAAEPVPAPKLRFQGQYFDSETGLHYNLFRYYDPGPGRFVSLDPVGLAGGTNGFQYAPNSIGWIDPLGLAAAGQLGTYGSLNGGTNVGDQLGAHELVRHEALVKMGCTSKRSRMSDNPSIALDGKMHGAAHANENMLAIQHLGVGVNQFQFGSDGKPTRQQMDVWQGALRKSGIGGAQARRLRKQSDEFLKKLCCCP